MSDGHPISLLMTLTVAELTISSMIPGDIVIQRENITIYIPIVTMLIVSIVLSVIFMLVTRWLNNK